MTDFLGIEVDAMIILTVFLVIETLVIIVLTIKLLRKRSSGIEPSTVELIKEVLKKVPTPLDPKEPPVVSKEDIKKGLKRKNLLLKKEKGYLTWIF